MREICAFVVSCRAALPARCWCWMSRGRKAGEHTAGVQRQYLGVRGPGGQRHKRRVRQLSCPGRARHHRRSAVCAWGTGPRTAGGVPQRHPRDLEVVTKPQLGTERDYRWAWLATGSARRHLLIRRHLRDHIDLAYFLCPVPAAGPARSRP
jgi:hypothetical protein